MSAFPWARPGVEVVCVWDGPWLGTLRSGRRVNAREVGVQVPLKGSTYVIRSVNETPLGIGLLLVEIRNTTRNASGEEVSFRVERFAPLVRKSQSEDIALFKRIASEQPVEGV